MWIGEKNSGIGEFLFGEFVKVDDGDECVDDGLERLKMNMDWSFLLWRFLVMNVVVRDEDWRWLKVVVVVEGGGS